MSEPWWREAVIYQIYTRSFQDSDGDGVGDLNGVIQRLDHLAALGVDAIWLSPLHPGPNVDLGYDGTDYHAIAPEFGDLATFDRLVAEARRRGIRVMLDLVLDYTSSAHPWFVEARASRTSPKHDWYIWRDGPVDRPPNDWPAFFSSGPAWTFDQPTRRWYLHYFTAEQPELNWANPDVRRAMHDVMRFWLDRGIAGFRLDVISFLAKPPLDQPLPEEHRGAPGRFYANNPALHEYLREIRAVLDEYPGTVALGEGFGVSVEDATAFVAPERGELDLIMLFELSALAFAQTEESRRPEPDAIRAILSSIDRHLVAAGGWPTLFLGNHDVARMLDRFGDPSPPHRAASAKLLLTMLLTLRGTPIIYQGDEIGMTNTRFGGLDEFRDVAIWNAWRVAPDEAAREAVLARARRSGRDTGRGPVRWTAGEAAGFTTGTPWIKVDADAPGFSVAEQQSDSLSPLGWARRLGALRKQSEALRVGDLQWVDCHRQLVAFDRAAGDQRIRIILNWGGSAIELDPPLRDRPFLSSLDGEIRARSRAEPWEALVSGAATAVAGAQQ